MNGHSARGAGHYNSTFQWSAHNPYINRNKPEFPTDLKDITVKEILVKYDGDPELLKYILSAKAGEDKRTFAKTDLKTQEVRIQLKQMDIEIAREQTKAHACYGKPPFQAQGIPFYKHAPVQEQVLARFSYPHQSTPKNHHILPPSPVTLYPHSAHPLCPPNHLNGHHVPPPPPNPNAPYRFKIQDAKNHLKRNRSSISNDTTDNQSHNKVIEALKAKIRRKSITDTTPIKEKVVGRVSSAAVRKQEYSIIPLSPSSLSPSSAKSHLTIEAQMEEKKSSYCNGKGDKSDPLLDIGHTTQ